MALRPCPLLAAVLGAAFVLLPARQPVHCQPGPDNLVLRYGVSLSALSDVNPNDALAATLLFTRKIGKAVGAWSDVRAQLLDDSRAVVKALNGGSVDMVAMSSMEFLSAERDIKADPFILYVSADGVTQEYVLLAREGIRSVADLAGRRVAVFNGSNQRDVGDTWLDVLLMESGLPGAGRALPELRVTRKRSQATMTLFFGQVDAAVETRAAFETAVELNPQIGRGVKVLARSPGLLQGLVCVRRSLDPSLRRRYLDKALTMHLAADSQQTFMVLRVQRLVPFESRFLADTRALAERFDALRRKARTR